MTAPKKLSPGIDRPKHRPGTIRARYRCEGCDRSGHENGGQHSQSWPERGNVREATRWLNEQLAAVEDGRHVDRNDRRTVAEYAARHIEVNVRLRDSSRDLLTSRLRHLDATGLGRQRLQAVTRSDITAWVADRSSVLSPRTVRDLYGFLRGMFAEAVADGVIASTPCQRIALPEILDEESDPLTRDEVEALALAMPERYQIGVLLQGALGLRVSELLGLQRQDIDLHRRVVHVRRQLARDGHSFGPTKTKASRRTIPLAAPVALALGQHIAKHGQAPAETVMITPRRNPVSQKVYGENFRKAVSGAPGVPEGTTPHSLRDHCASVLIASAVPVNIVADLLGHSDGGALLLKVYARIFPSAEDVARGALDTAWSQNVSPGVSQAPAQGAR